MGVGQTPKTSLFVYDAQMTSNENTDNRLAHFKQIVGHMVIHWGSQIRQKSGVYLLKNKNRPDHVFLISQEITAEKMIALIKDEHITHLTGYHFCQSEADLQHMEMTYSSVSFLRHQRLFLMQKKLEPESPNSDVIVHLAQTKAEVNLVMPIARQVGWQCEAYPLPPQKTGMKLYYILENNQVKAWARNAQGVDGSSWVSDVYTIPSARKKGLASSIMQKIHQDNVAIGNTQVFLGVYQENIEFYQKLGYEIALYGVHLTSQRNLWQKLAARVTAMLKQ